MFFLLYIFNIYLYIFFFLAHQQATPSYINPIPWIVDDTPSEMQNVPNCHKLTAILTKNKITKTVVSQR